MLLQDVKANASVAVDVWVKNLCPKGYLKHNAIKIVSNKNLDVQQAKDDSKVKTTSIASIQKKKQASMTASR